MNMREGNTHRLHTGSGWSHGGAIKYTVQGLTRRVSSLQVNSGQSQLVVTRVLSRDTHARIHTISQFRLTAQADSRVLLQAFVKVKCWTFGNILV